MKHNQIRKAICVLVTAILLISVFPIDVFAAHGTNGSKRHHHNPHTYEYHEDLKEIIETSEAKGINENHHYGTRRLIVLSSYDNLQDDYDAAQVATSSLGVTILQYDTEAETQEAYEGLVQDVGASRVEVDQVFHACFDAPETISPYVTPSFSDVPQQLGGGNYLSYGPEMIGADVFVNKMSSTQKMQSVVVAVVDSGVLSSHPFLSGRMVAGAGYYNGGSSSDDNGHGTHVAGIIADTTQGTNIKIMPVKVLDADGSGYNSTVASGIQYAIEHGAQIVNLSLGGYDTSSSHYLDAVIKGALTNGFSIVAAAGNDNTNCASFCPAHISGLLCVSAVDSSCNKAYFSNYGTNVGVASPGVSIYSTSYTGGYVTMSGTSMAAPFASASVALMKAAYPSASPSAIFSVLRNYSYDVGAKGWDQYYGQGIISMEEIPLSGAIGETPVVPTQVPTQAPTQAPSKPTPTPVPTTVPTPTTQPGYPGYPYYPYPGYPSYPGYPGYPYWPTVTPTPTPTPTPTKVPVPTQAPVNPNPGNPWGGWQPPQMPTSYPVVPMYGVSVSVSSQSRNGVGSAVIRISTQASLSDLTVLIDGMDYKNQLVSTGNGTYEIRMSGGHGNHTYYVSCGSSTSSGSFSY
ncbi:MAG: S8 family serine peptidase [Lachnospiraceae bacterium]|nr:S8 family serine peptidase [Candidatus Merdinaster equi]